MDGERVPWYIKECELIGRIPLYGRTAHYLLSRYQYGHSVQHGIFHLLPQANGDILRRYREELSGKLPYLLEGDSVQLQTDIFGHRVNFTLREYTLVADESLYGSLLVLPEPIIRQTLTDRAVALMYDYVRVVYQGQVILYVY